MRQVANPIEKIRIVMNICKKNIDIRYNQSPSKYGKSQNMAVFKAFMALIQRTAELYYERHTNPKLFIIHNSQAIQSSIECRNANNYTTVDILFIPATCFLYFLMTIY